MTSEPTDDGTSAPITTADTQSSETEPDESTDTAELASTEKDDDDAYEPGHDPVARRSLGITRRKKRVLRRTWELFLTARRETLSILEKEWDEWHRRKATEEDPGPEPESLDESELFAKAEAFAKSEDPPTELELVLYDEWSPGLFTAEAVAAVEQATGRSLSRKVLWAAVNRDPVIVWLRGYLTRRTGTRGPRPARKLLACAFLLMAFGRGRPCLEFAAEDFLGDPLLAWAFGYPDDDIAVPPTGGAFNAGLHQMLESADDRAAEAIQLDTWKRLAEATGIDERGKVVPLFPHAGQVLVLDYSFVEAEVEQVSANDPTTGKRDPAFDRAMNGSGRDLVRYVTYSSDGRFRRRNRGYKVGALVDLATNAAPKADVTFGAVDEPKDSVRMVGELLATDPDFPPIRYVLGDRLFQHERDVAREFLWRFGIIPSFTARADDPDAGTKGPDWAAAKREWAESGRPEPVVWRGVPYCHLCQRGREDNHERGGKRDAEGERRREEPMRLDGWADKFWSQEARIESIRKRDAAELEDGEKCYERDQWVDRAAQRARLRFKCDVHAKVTHHVRPDDDPRVFSALPHVGPSARSPKGESEPVVLRRVFGWRRNAVESFFAALQHLGVAGKAGERPKWAKDDDMAWLLKLSIACITLRKLVMLNGAYEFAYGQARALGLLAPMTRSSPGLPVDPAAVARAEERWPEEFGPARAPLGWHDPEVWPVPYGTSDGCTRGDRDDDASRNDDGTDTIVRAGEQSVDSSSGDTDSDPAIGKRPWRTGDRRNDGTRTRERLPDDIGPLAD